MRTYVRAVTKKSGHTYHYLRGPTHRRGDKIRLSDDREIANRQAKAFLDLKAMPSPGDNKKSNVIERKIAGKLLANAGTRSKRRSLSIDLTSDVIIQMLRDQDYRCAISGLPFDLSWRHGRNIFRNPYAPSIDRRDSKLGYVRENCRVILSAVNYGINEWGEEVYTSIACAVADRLKKRKSSTTTGSRPLDDPDDLF